MGKIRALIPETVNSQGLHKWISKGSELPENIYWDLIGNFCPGVISLTSLDPPRLSQTTQFGIH